MEGYFPGSLSYQNNNPGNIQYGSFAASLGGSPGAGGFAAFPDLASGTAAEDALVGVYASQGLNIQQAVDQWTGGGAPSTYAPYVANAAGVSTSTPLSSVQGTGSTTPATAPATSGGFWQSLGQALGVEGGFTGFGSVSGLGAEVTNPVTGIGTTGVAGLTWGRVAAFLLGLILIVVGLVGFDKAQSIVVETASKAKDEAIAA